MRGKPPWKRALTGVARSFQITSIVQPFSALDNVALAAQAHAGHSFRFWASARRDPALREPALRALAQGDEAQAWRELALHWNVAIGEGDPCVAARQAALACFRSTAIPQSSFFAISCYADAFFVQSTDAILRGRIILFG
jgi:hypothetical protein